jgi:hypothetical protein
VACNKTIPAGFWKSYKKDLLVENVSDQGPYGGHSAIYWKSDRSNKFSSIQVLEFAKQNDWILVDSSAYSSDQTNKWTYNKKNVFPLTSAGFSGTVENNTALEHFPRWFGGPIKVYIFKTGWVTIEPGTDHSIEENGFVTINSDGTAMAVYHLWGE